MNNSDTYYLKRCVKKALLPLRMPEPLNLCEWAEQNFYLSAESSYVEGRFNAVPWHCARQKFKIVSTSLTVSWYDVYVSKTTQQDEAKAAGNIIFGA